MDPSAWPTWTHQTFILLVWCLIRTSIADNEPTDDFCQLWGHRSAVVNRKLYIDGGVANNNTDTLLAYMDLDSSDDGMTEMSLLHTILSKNDTIPSTNGGILWEDTVNRRLYLYGGEYYETPSSDEFFSLWSYDILYNKWEDYGPATGKGVVNEASSYGAGISIPSRGEAYYYGGWLNDKSVPGWKGPPRATNGMIKYTMQGNSWKNLTGPDRIRRAEGIMASIPLGDAGMLVYFGGIQDLYGNGTLTPQPLDQIFLFDVANETWYTQNTSGHTPEPRRRFCGGATWVRDYTSCNIYITGGAGFPPNTTGYDDIYILTIPSFQWIRSSSYPAKNQITGNFPKSMMSCNVVDYAQMLVLGGKNTSESNICLDFTYPGNNIDLGEQNSESEIWWNYQPNLTTYALPTDILTAVGGKKFGGATKTTPISGFDTPKLSALMTRTSTPVTRKPTRAIPSNTSSPSKSRSLGAGGIAGVAVGCSVALILALMGCCCLIIRRRRYYSRSRIVAQPPVKGISKTYHHDPADQGSVRGDQQSRQLAGPPAELTGESGQRYRHRSSSPASGRFQSGSGDPPAELTGESGQQYRHHNRSLTSGRSQSDPERWQPETTSDRALSSPRRSPDRLT
ncbi:hypothetical protein DER44DRAFT_681191 [Fusarium oxysporum]|nr:hypothetical protein DER44DRAFT_681191 [Fusarium oxysporum]